MYERQRVWRACQPCRRKKIKCDGEQPCHSCSKGRADCTYTDPFSNMRTADPQYVARLEHRLQSMEKIMKQHRSIPLSRQENSAEGTGNTYENSCSSEMVGEKEIVQERSGQNIEGQRCSNRHVPVTVQESNTAMAEIDPSLFDYGIISCETPYASEHGAASDSALPSVLTEALINQFYRESYPIFPIIREVDFRRQFRDLDASKEDATSFSAVYHALLAVAASAMSSEHSIFKQPEAAPYKSLDLGDLFFSQADKQLSLKSHKATTASRLNSVIAHGLLSLYLAETGRVTDAWIMTGHAIRLYQGLDLNESCIASIHCTAPPGRSAFWWCLYILDRSLSTVLLKPLAIDDVECDVSLSDVGDRRVSGPEEEIDPWFSVITEFHITMGRIYKSVRSMRRIRPSGSTTLLSSLQEHDVELKQYYAKQVLPNIKHVADDVRTLALQNIAVSSYFIGVVLLYRQFIESFEIEDPEIYLRCAEAASKCIKLAPEVFKTVRASHFKIQQCRAIYASIKVLLRCMRQARSKEFNTRAWEDVGMGFRLLQTTKTQWADIDNYRRSTEEDIRLTKLELEKHEKFRSTFARFGSSTHSASAVERGLRQECSSFGTQRGRKRSISEVGTSSDCFPDPGASKRLETVFPCTLRSSDLSGLFGTGTAEMEEDESDLSFMLDFASTTPCDITTCNIGSIDEPSGPL